MTTNILWLSDLGLDDIGRVGGKNASLGELIHNLGAAGVNVPEGFATTADAFRTFLAQTGLEDRIAATLLGLDSSDTLALARAGRTIREDIIATPLPEQLESEIRAAYATLTEGEDPAEPVSWAVRSSATAEDLPDASFAGQQETFLNIRGIDQILQAVHEVFASLYNDRAISYRVHHGFAHLDVALSVGIQRMVRSDLASSGVMFTIDTESGFSNAVLITSAYGLGEGVVQGAVNPDEFVVYKPALNAGRPAILKRTAGEKATKMIYTKSKHVGRTVEFVPVTPVEARRFSLNDAEIEELARYAVSIEEHYGRPMDIEWAKDGIDGRLYIVQARPETVVARRTGRTERFVLGERGTVVTEGRAIGHKIGAGPARVLSSIEDMHQFNPGDVLVADMTDPDWEPVMKMASAIITNRGGRTCHAAIIARELGVPAVVGTGDATSALVDGQQVTVSCGEGETGYVYEGTLDFSIEYTDLGDLPEIPTSVMMNVGTPEQAFNFAQTPNDGIGLARLEFIINRQIGIHPKALLDVDDQAPEVAKEIRARIAPYAGARDFFVKRVAEGVSTLAAAFAPGPVIVRMSDFKSNEYANLVGGDRYEPDEENPMLGFRGASRYVSPGFRECFDLECQALKFVRDEMGLTNVKIMIPFVRTIAEAEAVIAALAENGLVRGQNGLQVVMMCEVPSNAVLAHEFLNHFDGFSIGSNDLTQLTLGVDRDSAEMARVFDERDPAVLKILSMAIEACVSRGKYVGICGQGPSDHPDFAEWLLSQGISSISLNPDTVVETWQRLGRMEAAKREAALV
ncbi:phosphoenolpyruvate synthase [Agromyces luteolus]|uniref:Phosphoenolpyruvate synthase n=1 Tax=Agromyces luteolus TaxID=88373 RepID=A0A7C9HS66_9MICO|nr:phosphoenolpyruvate synthase [Agromyces luteolus]MUN08149.1 phosphoenolpyruvate synthase [Agromyces luteolus]GLK29615.1 phosphoenolpyruvate synthase [Agromyces luteolus]